MTLDNTLPRDRLTDYLSIRVSRLALGMLSTYLYFVRWNGGRMALAESDLTKPKIGLHYTQSVKEAKPSVRYRVTWPSGRIE